EEYSPAGELRVPVAARVVLPDVVVLVRHGPHAQRAREDRWPPHDRRTLLVHRSRRVPRSRRPAINHRPLHRPADPLLRWPGALTKRTPGLQERDLVTLPGDREPRPRRTTTPPATSASARPR